MVFYQEEHAENAAPTSASMCRHSRRHQRISELAFRRLIKVQDSGPGLDPKSLDLLFDAFYTTKPQGMGMGLAISRSIIEAHSHIVSVNPTSKAHCSHTTEKAVDMSHPI
jgi:C4-dicarboxylate-specific signal transduction histidine kinase